MLEPSARGSLEILLDPSNPSVNKQTMLDWLRIHYPKTVIGSKLNKSEVAKIVREKQPQFFPDPNSQSAAVLPEITDVYPTLEQLRVSSPISSGPSANNEQFFKRSASQELERPHSQKRFAIGTEAKPQIDPRKMLKKKKPSSSRPTPTKITPLRKPAKPIVSNWLDSLSVSLPQVSSISGVSNEDEQKELETLKQSIFVPLNNQSGTSPNPGSQNLRLPTITLVKQEASPVNLFFNTHSDALSVPDQSKIQGQKTHISSPKHVHFADDTDLIQFSDTEVFDVGNLVIGRDIPALKLNEDISVSKKKTGVDVFQEQLKREAQVQTLEERIAHLESKLDGMEEKASKNVFQELAQEQVNAAQIENHSSLLDEAMKKITILQSKVEDLEVETCDLESQLDIAQMHIKGHKRAIKQLLGPEYEDLEEFYDQDSEDNYTPYNYHENDASPTNDNP